MDRPIPPAQTLQRRPRLALWMFLHGQDRKDAAEALDCGVELVRRYCLPFGHALRKIPDERRMELIRAWTDSEIGPADFYPADEPTCPACHRPMGAHAEPAVAAS